MLFCFVSTVKHFDEPEWWCRHKKIVGPNKEIQGKPMRISNVAFIFFNCLVGVQGSASDPQVAEPGPLRGLGKRAASCFGVI